MVVQYGDPEAVARRVLEAVRVGESSLEEAPELAASSLISTGPAASDALAASASMDVDDDGEDDDDEDDGNASDDDGPLAALLRARQSTGLLLLRPASLRAYAWAHPWAALLSAPPDDQSCTTRPRPSCSSRSAGRSATLGFTGRATPVRQVRTRIGPMRARSAHDRVRLDVHRAALHDDESIFPYARSRVGRTYQIDVPPTGGVPGPYSSTLHRHSPSRPRA